MSGSPDRLPAGGSSSLPVVPPEILRFFREPRPRTLTVRGEPGSGKTSLALATLAAYPGFRAFVSTTVDRDSLLHQFPWLSDARQSPVELVEFLRFRSPALDSAVDISEMRTALQARASDLVDVASVLSLPPALHQLLSAHADEPKMVAVDSWEAWIGNLLGPTSSAFDVPTTRWELERTILGQILRTGAHVLLVAERSEPSRFDYVADEVVTLTASELEGRRERWIALSKLRGTEVESPSYPFTLEGGKFRCIVPQRLPTAGPFQVGDEPDPSPSDPSLWPGLSAVAGWFGRIPPMGYTLIETDSETPVLSLWRLAAPAVLAALRAGGRALVRPPGNLTAAGLRQNFVPALPSLESLDRLGVVVPTPGSPPAEGFALARLNPSGELLPWPSETEPLEAGSGHLAVFRFLGAPSPVLSRNLVVIFPDPEVDLSLEAHRADPFLGVPSQARREGSRFGALIVMHTDDPHVEQIRVRNAVHIVARTRRGQLFLYGVRPWTPLLVPVAPAPSSPFQLIPVV